MSIKNNSLYSPLVYLAKFVGRNFPELLVKIRYFIRFRRYLNLKNPHTLNEKILYMSLRTDTTLWTRLADKYAVRSYVEECGISEILTPLLGYWRKAEEIDLSLLPKQFVVKTTHGCGDVIAVTDKSKIDPVTIQKYMHAAVSKIYGTSKAASIICELNRL